VLALANRLTPKLGGAEKTLRATRADGPEPVLRGFESSEEEGAFVLERVRALAAEGVPYEEMAVLVRLNSRSADFEELFGDARIPFQGAALLARDGARQLLKGLRGAGFGSLGRGGAAGSRVQQGLVDRVPDKVGERELVRQADLARLCKLAEEFDDGTKTVEQWSSGCARGSTTGRRAASTCSRSTVRRARVRGRLPARGSRRRSCRARRPCARRTRSPRSGGCSTSA
jgi:superfamily I DNA/RNA helicase